MKYLKVKVVPGAKKEIVTVRTEDSFLITTTEPREENRATTRVRELLARHLGVPIARLSLVRGATTPNKLFLLRD